MLLLVDNEYFLRDKLSEVRDFNSFKWSIFISICGTCIIQYPYGQIWVLTSMLCIVRHWAFTPLLHTVRHALRHSIRGESLSSLSRYSNQDVYELDKTTHYR